MNIGDSKGEKMLRICFCDDADPDKELDAVTKRKHRAAGDINYLEGVAHLLKQRKIELEREGIELDIEDDLNRIEKVQNLIIQLSLWTSYLLTSKTIQENLKL